MGQAKTKKPVARWRGLPAVQKLLEEPLLRQAALSYGREAVLAGAREALAEERAALSVEAAGPAPQPADLARRAAEKAAELAGGGIRRALNATGVILHTGLGRAPLAVEVMEDLRAELGRFALVETDLETGKRGRRDGYVETLLKRLLKCQAATAVNNNAAAVLLALTALALGREAIVSRGQLIEIGGSFRIPEVMALSGARLVEVGATNRTHLRDYERALTPDTALLLLVHTSNFRQIGFTKEVELAELVRLGRSRGVPVLYDIGSGALCHGLAPQLREEPLVAEALAAGADLVTFSGDKILGGPQAGILAGRNELLALIRQHPLWRAFRLDKLILRALETTLRLYLDPERRGETIPALRLLRRPLEELRAEAERLAGELRRVSENLTAETAGDNSRLGSGSLPERDIPTVVVRLKDRRGGAEALAARLRGGRPPVVTRIQDGWVLLDPRTLFPGEAEEVVAVARQVLGAEGPW